MRTREMKYANEQFFEIVQKIHRFSMDVNLSYSQLCDMLAKENIVFEEDKLDD